MHTNHPSERERLERAAADVRRFSDRVPKVALVLGSGLGAWADTLQDRVVIPFGEIAGMPQSGVAGHAGNLVLGTSEGVSVVTMQGRVHIITNAAGGIGDHLDVGDLMLIEDQLNLTGKNPLVGPNDERMGPRFVDMTTPFDLELRRLASEGAKALGFEVKRGVYVGVLGPSYETPAEIRMYRTMGGDAVGMSTVLEVVAARHLGARVLGVSCITNKAAGLGHEVLTHEDVQDVAVRVRERFVALLGAVLRRLL
jgi:purine-nucleoside phosphorylase